MFRFLHELFDGENHGAEKLVMRKFVFKPYFDNESVLCDWAYYGNLEFFVNYCFCPGLFQYLWLSRLFFVHFNGLTS